MRHECVRIDSFQYHDCWGRLGACAIEALKLRDGRVTVIATELRDNPGMSITNAAEYVATELCQYLGVDPVHLVWIEHYGYPAPAGFPKRTYDLVTFARITPGESRFFHEPTWRVMKEADWQSLGLPPRD